MLVLPGSSTHSLSNVRNRENRKNVGTRSDGSSAAHRLLFLGRLTLYM